MTKETEDRINDLAFHLGSIMGLCSQPDVTEYFLSKKLTKKDLDNFSNAIMKLIQVFYKERRKS